MTEGRCTVGRRGEGLFASRADVVLQKELASLGQMDLGLRIVSVMY